jgi:hypothetical protein
MDSIGAPARPVSRPAGHHQRLDAHDVHLTGDILSRDVQRHLGGGSNCKRRRSTLLLEWRVFSHSQGQKHAFAMRLPCVGSTSLR